MKAKLMKNQKLWTKEEPWGVFNPIRAGDDDRYHGPDKCVGIECTDMKRCDEFYYATGFYSWAADAEELGYKSFTSKETSVGATQVFVQMIDGCLPGGKIIFSPLGAVPLQRTIASCAVVGVDGPHIVELVAGLGQVVPSRTPVIFIAPNMATVSTAATPAGATTVEVKDASSCSVGGTITFASKFPETLTVASCGTRRLMDDSGEMPSERRLTKTVKTQQPVKKEQPAGTAITFTAAPSPSSCFAMEASSQVASKAGRQPLAELRVGERVLADGVFTEVIGFLHDKLQAADVIVIEHAAGELRASGNHILLVDGQEKEARTVESGNMVSLSDGSLSPVIAVRRDAALGLRAPLTASGLIDIDGVLASNYANGHGTPVPHATMHAAFCMVRIVLRVFSMAGKYANFQGFAGLAMAQSIQMVS
eukprot:TRINITY_DN18316_c0_g1_i2.p1 TRINITY_DN18316_c0_g1~~TRINITY_DN18316_c0_g1_i2.p1  ORF type:complete len:422 (-),score=73.83 TRINITY_DN18316_c0_g1_i2:117-1382(-)